jgi:hypothetical protein
MVEKLKVGAEAGGEVREVRVHLKDDWTALTSFVAEFREFPNLSDSFYFWSYISKCCYGRA